MQRREGGRRGDAEEGKMNCVYMKGFPRFVLIFVNISVEKQMPPPTPLTPPPLSAILLMNWQTPKHLGPPLCTGPLLLLYNFSADACTVYTVFLVFMVLRLNLMLLQQLQQLHINLSSSLSLFPLFHFLTFDQSVSLSLSDSVSLSDSLSLSLSRTRALTP